MHIIEYDPTEVGTSVLNLSKAARALGGAVVSLHYSEVDDGWWVEISINQIGGENSFIGRTRTLFCAIAQALEWVEEHHGIKINAP